LPLDQDNIPDVLFDVGEIGISNGIPHPPAVGDVAIAFYLGDVNINPEAVYMGMSQRFYYSPRTYISHINPVLNAAGDVIRYSLTGEENCRLFLIGDASSRENIACNRYLDYLNKHKGWL